MTDVLMMQKLREWAEDAAADDGDVIIPGRVLVELLDLLDES